MTSANAAIAKRSFAQLWIGASVCGLAFGATAASSALSYASSFSTAAARQQLVATTSTDRGLAILLGPISGVDSVGGYTVYKGFVFLTTIGALWAILAATRVLRGEEDSGRWQLVLAGSTRAPRATAATIGALAAAVGVIFVGTALVTFLAGLDRDVGFRFSDTLVYGVSVVMPAAVFASVGALTSQLSRTRRTATSLGMAVFAMMFVLRMIADSGAGMQWLRWTTPLGWSEIMRPFTDNDLVPLAPAALATAVLCLAAVVLASRRDVGDGVFASPDVVAPRPFGLSSAFGIAARLELRVLSAWCIGLAALGLTFGIIAKMTTAKLPPSLGDTLDRFGVRGSFATQYLGVVFLLVATVVALLPAGQVGAACDEETSGRLVHLLGRPLHRTSWFIGRLALAALGIVTAALLAGFGTWVGAASQGVGVDLTTMIGAGLNVVPTALVVLGIGALVLSVAPRAAGPTVYAVITWSLLADLVASMVSGVAWLERASLFHYMALAPAQDIQPPTIAITVGIALLLGSIATVQFNRRDVRSG